MLLTNNDYHVADSTCDPCSNCNGEQSKCEASSGCTYDAGNEVCLPDDGMYIDILYLLWLIWPIESSYKRYYKLNEKKY